MSPDDLVSFLTIIDRILPILYVDSRKIVMVDVTDLLYWWLVALPMNVGLCKAFSVDQTDAQQQHQQGDSALRRSLPLYDGGYQQ